MPLRSTSVAPRASLGRNRAFLLLWGGQAVSSVGSQISQLALPLLALALTGSIAQAGFASAVRTIPYLALGLPAGALIDRWNRKRVMLLCDTGRALCLASVGVALALGRLSMAQLYLVTLAEGTCYVFFNVAEVSSLPYIVSAEHLPAASARNEAAANVSYLLGPLLGGALYAIGRALPFLVDAVSYCVSVISLLFIPGQFQSKRSATPRRHLAAEIGEGLSWLWGYPLVRLFALLSAGGWLVESGYILVIIRLAQRQHASAAVIGVIFAIGGMGGIAGAVLAEVAQRHFSLRQLTLGVHWIWALLLPLFAVASTPLALGAVTAAAFGITPVCAPAQYSYRQIAIPDALRGRVNSVFRLIIFAGQPLGVGLAGVLLQSLGPDTTIFVLCALLLALALGATRSPSLRAHRTGEVASPLS